MADTVDSALVIMAKTPMPGAVKTRLCPPIDSKLAAEFYFYMLKDKISQALSVPNVEVFLALPEDSEDEKCREIAGGCRQLSQHGDDLGERLCACAQAVFDMGYARVLLVDSDSPTLPPLYFARAVSMLRDERRQVIIGPTSDGGYYLIGLSSPCREIFRDIPWSTSDVLARTLERAADSDIEVALLPEWYDVDTEADLDRLVAELSDSSNALLAPNTATWLEGWKQRRE
ncbi:MAG: TIGR04282 family arsenosugar biosynthesis glycosyltransferase [Armatimonadetes bacterium]|nr:TIGR04282 family arsenosugar biosynthesis glycosyltransferase [Armatimonadota bacterium]